MVENPKHQSIRQQRRLRHFDQPGGDVLAWPHFVMDDDAYRPASWGIVHSEVRYIQGILQRLQRTGIDRVMGNLYLPYLQISNTYAYGRLLENPQEDPREIILDFSRLIAHPEDAERLAEVMTWAENQSYWEVQLPEDARLAPLDCSLTRQQAQLEVGKIRPHYSPGLPLPIKPEQWLLDLETFHWPNDVGELEDELKMLLLKVTADNGRTTAFDRLALFQEAVRSQPR